MTSTTQKPMGHAVADPHAEHSGQHGANDDTTVEYWADRITLCHRKSFSAVLELCAAMEQAFTKLDADDYDRALAMAGYDRRSAEMLRSIARHPTLNNPNHGSVFPASWRTDYELSRIDPDKLEKAAEDGLVTPTMTRKEAEALKRQIAEPGDPQQLSIPGTDQTGPSSALEKPSAQPAKAQCNDETDELPDNASDAKTAKPESTDKGTRSRNDLDKLKAEVLEVARTYEATPEDVRADFVTWLHSDAPDQSVKRLVDAIVAHGEAMASAKNS